MTEHDELDEREASADRPHALLGLVFGVVVGVSLTRHLAASPAAPASLAASAAAQAAASAAASGAQTRGLTRSRARGDNMRWTDAEVAAWKCCAEIVSENGTTVNNPPFAVPTAIYSDQGELYTTLTVQQTRFDGPKSFNTRGYGATTAYGPTLYLKRGDWLRVDLENSLDFPTSAFPYASDPKARVAKAIIDATGECLPYGEPNVTSLHVHGLHTNVDGYGDYPLKMAHPQETVPYHLYVRPDHPTGTFWYHPHAKDSASLQEAGMMAGVLIVEDDANAWPSSLSDMTDRVMLLQWVDSTTDAYHDFDNYTWLSKCSGSNMNTEIVDYGTAGDNFVVVNGQYLPEVDIGTGEYQRWRLVNAISHALLNITIIDDKGDAACEMWEIAADGVYYANPRQTDKVFVTLGGRKDVIVQCPHEGTYTMTSNAFTGKTIYYDPSEFSGSIAKIRVWQDDSTTSVALGRINLPSAGLYSKSLERARISENNKYTVTLANDDDSASLWMTMNGVIYNGLVEKRIQLDAAQEWTIKSSGHVGSEVFDNHNWHLHTHHFQVVSSSVQGDQTLDWHPWDWRDTVNIPYGGWVTVRFVPENYAGYLLHHCHVFNHETAGLKQLVAVINCTDDYIYEHLKMYAEEPSASTDFCTYTYDDDDTSTAATTDDDSSNSTNTTTTTTSSSPLRRSSSDDDGKLSSTPYP